MKINIIEEIKERLSIFTNFYDVIRVIDPISKEIKATDASFDYDLNSTCYYFWKKKKVCNNCVSIRALKENNTFMKIESRNDRVFLTTASPVKVDGRTFIVELLKDITNEKFTIKPENEHAESIEKLITSVNDEVVTDSLTGLYNRRFLDHTLPLDIEESSINRYPLSVILTDIDHFKIINDTYGHLAGDYILKEFTKLISKTIRRSTDWIARYGGEEFLVVLKNTDGDEAYIVAEKLRKLVEETEFIYTGMTIKVTASFGICHLENYESINSNNFINCADKNLYTAKENGRNQVVIGPYNSCLE